MDCAGGDQKVVLDNSVARRPKLEQMCEPASSRPFVPECMHAECMAPSSLKAEKKDNAA